MQAMENSLHEHRLFLFFTISDVTDDVLVDKTVITPDTILSCGITDPDCPPNAAGVRFLITFHKKFVKLNAENILDEADRVRVEDRRNRCLEDLQALLHLEYLPEPLPLLPVA